MRISNENPSIYSLINHFQVLILHGDVTIAVSYLMTHLTICTFNSVVRYDLLRYPEQLSLFSPFQDPQMA
jgi:hypothetical protein